MARDIRTTLSVDGEQAYTRAIREASKHISQMGTQLTLATAEFKKDGDAMKLMESRSKTLRAEIDQQEKIVKSLEGAVQDMTEQYGENSKEAEKWQAELNRAKAKLANLQTELQNNDQGLDRNGRAFDAAKGKAQDFGEQLTLLQRIQQSTSFQAMNTALGKLENGFKSALSRGRELAAFIFNTASESSYWADDLATESTKLGVSPEVLQGWMDAAHFVDTEVSSIKSAIVKLTNPTDALKEAMRSLGIHTKDAFAVVEDNGAVDTEIVSKSAVDLMWEAVEALGRESDAVKRNQLANELFGKSYMDMLPLITAGKESWDEYVKSAEESGRVLDSETVGKLTTFNDAIEEFNAQMDAFQNTVMAGIAPGLTTVTEAGTKFLEQLTLWAQSETGQEKLEELSGAISGLVSSLATEENFNAVVEAATGVVNGLAEALNWIIDNHGTVEIGVGAIAGALGAVKVGSGVLSVLSLISQIKWLEVAQGAGALGTATGGATGGTAAGGAAAAAAGATAGDVISTWSTGSKLLDALGIGALLKTAKEASEDLGTGLWGYLSSENKKQIVGTVTPVMPGEPKRPRNITGTASADSMQGYVIERTAESIYDDLYKAINDYDPATNAMDTTQFFDNVLYPLIQEATGSGGVIGDASDSIADLIYDKWIQSLFDEDWEGTTDGLLNILQEAIEEAQGAAAPDAESAGQAVSDGVATGIDAGIPAAVDAAGRLAGAVNSKLRSMLQIASPSKVTRGLGRFVGIGFAEGIDDAISAVEAATGRMAVAVAGRGYGFGGAGAAGTYSPNYARTMNIQNYYQRSDADVNALMDAMNQEARYEREGRGA